MRVLSSTCPRCQQDKIYQGGFFNFKMNESCSNCGFKYEKEPGYFFGAMYVSYALSIAECMAIYFAYSWIAEESFSIYSLIPMIIALVILMPFNMKWSRIVWIQLFNK